MAEHASRLEQQRDQQPLDLPLVSLDVNVDRDLRSFNRVRLELGIPVPVAGCGCTP